ncbi:MAG TPA: VOC family protein [Novosphingobium sp.]
MMNDRPALAHLGIFVSDVDAMERFYTEVFGLVVTDRGVGKVFRNTLVFLSGAADQHHQLVLSSGKAPETPSTVMQLSFKVQTLDALRRRKRMAEDRGVSDVMPLNHGNAWSVYFNDPEGNRIEIYVDTPFHTPQPCGEPLDLDRSDAEILEATRLLVAELPGTMSSEAFTAHMTERLA